MGSCRLPPRRDDAKLKGKCHEASLAMVVLVLVMAPFGILGRKIPRCLFRRWLADLIEIPFLPVLWVTDKVSKWIIKTVEGFTVIEYLVNRWTNSVKEGEGLP